MNTISKRTSRTLACLFLVCTMILGACVPRPGSPDATTAAPFQEETAANYETYEESQLTARREFDQFTEDLFLDEVSANQLDFHFKLKNPSAYGLTSARDLYSPVTLDNTGESLAELKDLKEKVASFDLALLTEEQKLTLRILRSYIETQLMAEGLELYSQPLAPTIGVQAQLPILLSEYEFRNRQDIDDYLNLIAGLDEYYGEMLALAKQQSEAGLMMNDTSIDHVIESCESYLLVPGNNFMIDTFDSRLDTVPDLTGEEKEAYRQKNAALLESDFVPAHQLLIDGMTALKGTAVNQGGLSGLPKGKEYYRYLVYSNTGTSYNSIEDMLAAMEAQMEKDLKTVSTLAQNNPNLLDEFQSFQFRQTEPDAIMEELKTLAANDFPALPECSYTFKYVPTALELSLSPAFYLVPPIDDYKNNTIYINQNERYSANDRYTTIAHEGYPGHLYQNVYFRSRSTNNLRQILPVLGYSEGWATYVENYACTLDNGLSPELGQLLAANKIASLGLQACLDVYINYYGWTQEKVSDYLSDFYEDPAGIAENIFNAMVENPGNYIAYYVGYLEINNMREIAKTQLGDQFNLKEFHTFLLDLGPAPFDVIQPYFTSWLLSQKL